MNTPFISFSNETLNEQSFVNKGRVITAPCGHDHTLIPCDNGDESLLFYECGDKVFLAAVNHRLITWAKTGQ
jgi:hypothetical protein